MTQMSRLCFFLTAAIVTFLALTPAPIGGIIESGPARHMLAFGALPMMSSLAWPRLHPAWQFIAFALFGAAIEIAQLLMRVGRAAEWDDWANDLFATGFALLLVALLRTWVERQARLEAR